MHLIVALLFGGISLVTNIVGIAIPYWYHFRSLISGVETEVDMGLWRLCLEGNGTSACQEYVSPPDTAKVTRVLLVIGMTGIVFAIICLLLKQFLMKGQMKLHSYAGILSALAGFVMFLGILVYATANDIAPDDSTFASGFVLCIISATFAIATAILSSYIQV